MLPALSRLAHSVDLARVGREIGSTMRLVSALIIPIAAILMITGSGLAVLIFGYGAAVPAQAAIMGQIVSVFMFALLPFTLFYVLLRGFYALEDTRTPFFITLAFSLVWLVLAVPLFRTVGSGGPQVASLALAYGVSYWVGMTVSWILLARRLGGVDSARTLKALLRMAAAGAIALLVMLGTRALLVAYVTGLGSQDKASVLVMVVTLSAVGTLSYLAAALLLRTREVSEMIDAFKRRVRKW
jgi:putative peptidoglycan lipid II flippase